MLLNYEKHEAEEIVKLKERTADLSSQLAIAKQNYKYNKEALGKMRDKLAELKTSKDLNSEDFNFLLSKLPTPGAAVMQRLFRNDNSRKKFEPALKVFALSLHYLSPRAYELVRSSLPGCLPSPRTIKAWCATIDADPGFTMETLAILTTKALKTKAAGRNVVIGLSIDDISLKEQIDQVQGHIYGYPDMGEELKHLITNADVKANHSCVIMATSLDPDFQFKLPVGFFLFNTLSAAQRSEIVIKCIEKLQSTGAQVYSLTFDGHKSNVSMAATLGADFSRWKHGTSTLRTEIAHTAEGQPRIQLMLDPSHMIKLVRNAFGDLRVLTNGKGEEINWKFVENLINLQLACEFRAGNRLNHKHLNWKKYIMKVIFIYHINYCAIQKFSSPSKG
jgi:Transposase protein